MSRSRWSKRVHTAISVGLVGLFAFTILWFGVTPSSNSPYGDKSSEDAVAWVDGKEITRMQYADRLDRLTENYRQQLNEMFGQFRKMLKLEEKAIDSLIDERLHRRIFEQMDFTAGKEQIIEKLASNPYFSSSSVTREAMAGYLRAIGMSEQQLLAVMKEDLALEQFNNALKHLGRPTLPEIKAAFLENNMKRSFEYVELNSTNFRDQVVVGNEEELNSFLENKAEQYRKPRAIRFSYVEFKPTDFRNQVEISEEDLVAAYEEQQEKFREPKSYHLRKILIKKDTKAEESVEKPAVVPVPAEEKKENSSELTREQYGEQIRARLEKGEEFSVVAKEVSEDAATKESGGDLGWIKGSVLPAHLKEAVIKLDVGAYSPLIKGNDGLEIVYLEDVSPSRVKEFTEVKEEVRRSLQNELSPSYAEEAASSFHEAWTKNVEKLADFAKAQGKPVVALDKVFSVNDMLPGVEPGLVKKSLEFGEGDQEVFRLNSASYVIQIDEVRDSYIPKLEEVKDAVVNDYREEKSKELCQARARELLAMMSSGRNVEDAASAAVDGEKPAEAALPVKFASLQDLAKGQSLEVKKAGPFVGSNLNGAPFSTPESKKKALSLTMKSSVADEVITQGGLAYLLQLVSLEMPTEEATAEKLEKLREEEMSKTEMRIYKSIMGQLKKETNVKIEPSLLENVE